MHSWTVWTVCAALAGVWAAGTAGAACRPYDVSRYLTVGTSSGLITGHAANNSACVVEYLGIPYAKPPIDDLRFAPPQAFVSQAPFEAAEYGYDCPLSASSAVDYPGFTPQAQRIVSYFASGAGTPQSEDCLTLNVWSKPTATWDRASKPVIVFFYGGRFAIGNTDSPFYSGKYFAAAQDAVIVTVNYRINIFGFPGAPGEPQNLGLRDQRAAVEWVQRNIRGFGGDASRITIAGQSSGGVSVDYWTYAYQNDPIVNGIIAPSGNAFSFPVNAAGVPETNWNTVVAAVNCTDADDVMVCMRAANWTAIKTAAAKVKAASSTSVLRSIPGFYPVPDEEIVFSDYVNRTAAGRYAPVPVFLGHNDNEDGYYRIPAYARGIVPTDAQVTAFLLESFTCPVSYQARARRSRGIASFAWRYLADWNNTRLFNTSGAYHGVDLHMIFGASADVSGLPTEADQRALTSTMQQAWVAFSKDPMNGLTNEMGWPRFSPDTESLIVLGKNNSPVVQFVRPSEYDAPCSTITMGALGTSA